MSRPYLIQICPFALEWINLFDFALRADAFAMAETLEIRWKSRIRILAHDQQVVLWQGQGGWSTARDRKDEYERTNARRRKRDPHTPDAG